MTPDQHRKITVLSAHNFEPGSPESNFIGNMATFALMYPDNELSNEHIRMIEEMHGRIGMSEAA